MLSRKKKEEIVKELTEDIKSSKSIVFADFKGLAVKDMTTLKKQLKKEGSNFKVIKKNLIGIALANAKKSGVDMKKMEGQIAISISPQDEVSSAKIINDFSKGNDAVKILGGMLGEKSMDADEVMALAKLPGKDELLAKLVGTLKAPISGLVNIFQGNQRNLVQVLRAVAEAKQE